MDMFFEGTDWLCSPGTSGLREITGDGRVLQRDWLALLWIPFYQEISADGRVLRGDRLALLWILFLSGNFSWWMCSSRRQTGFALDSFLSGIFSWWTCSSRRRTGFAPMETSLLPWENRMGRGQTHRQTDIATIRKNGPKGQFFENRITVHNTIKSGFCHSGTV